MEARIVQSSQPGFLLCILVHNLAATKRGAIMQNTIHGIYTDRPLLGNSVCMADVDMTNEAVV